MRISVIAALLALGMSYAHWASAQPLPNEARLVLYGKENREQPQLTIWAEAGVGRDFVGSYKNLDDKIIDWNDKARSLVLYGRPGTRVRLYDDKNFQDSDDVVEIVIPAGSESVTVNDLDKDASLTWIKRNDGIAGHVSSIQWKAY